MISELRAPLVEATELHTEFKWSQSGAKIVEVLCHDDHNMSEALEDFKELTRSDRNVTASLHNLFAAISRQCAKEENYVDGNKRSAHSVGVFDRMGLKQDGSEKRQRKDGDACYDISNQTGGKCEGAGCPEVKQTKRLCTTCFHKLLDDGIVKTKSGGEIQKGHLRRSRNSGGKSGKGKGKGKGAKGKGKSWNHWSNSAKTDDAKQTSISTKALARAWKKANSAAAKDSSNDDTLSGADGPESKKLEVDFETQADVNQRSTAMMNFANSLSNMGVRVSQLEI